MGSGYFNIPGLNDILIIVPRHHVVFAIINICLHLILVPGKNRKRDDLKTELNKKEQRNDSYEAIYAGFSRIQA